MNSLRLLWLTAWTSVGLHLLGLGLALLGMRSGTAVVPLAERTAYLAGRPLGWVVGWSVWALCALVLVGFLGTLLARAKTRAQALVRGLAVVLAGSGAAVDLLCDTLWIALIPRLALDADMSLFRAFERLLLLGGAVVANGLYSLAVLLVSLTLREGRALGWATWGFGMLMVAAGFGGDPRHLEWLAGPMIGAFLGWTLVVARAERRRG